MNHQGISRWASAIAAACVAALAGPMAVAGQADNSIVYGQSIAVTGLDPANGAFTNYPAGYEVAFALYDRLVTFDENLAIGPQLAESWEISDDQTAVTFHLRQGVVFHDGTPFDAEAVKFNVERMMDADRNPTNRPLWDPIVAADVVDRHTVIIRTSKPFGLLLNTLAHGSGAMVSPTLIREQGDDAPIQHPVGAGPYMLDSFEPGQQVVLKPFPDYWAGKPQLDQVVFRYIPEASTRIAALQSGGVDVIDAVPVQLLPGLQGDPNLTVLTKPGLRPMGLSISMTRPPFDDLRVRRALNHAIPVQTIAERIFFGFAKASDAPLAFNTSGYRSIGGFGYDVDRAKAMLAEAGFADSNGDGIVERGGNALTATLVTTEGVFPGDLQVAEIAANSFKDIGIDVTIRKIERGSYFDHVRRPLGEVDWDLAMFGFNPSNASGAYHLDSMFSSNAEPSGRPSVWNFARYSNAEVDTLLAKANETVDLDRQTELLGQAQEIADFCAANYSVSFPMTAKVPVIGGNAHPFYAWIADELGEDAAPKWNFHKYLIGPDGELAGAWPSKVAPHDGAITEAVETALTG